MKPFTFSKKICSFVDNHSNSTMIFDKFVTFLLVMCPILQHYKSFFMEASAVICIVLLPYFALKLLYKRVFVFGAVLPLILFSLYEIVNHGTNIMEIAREMLLLVYFLAAASGAIDLKFYIKSATLIAIVACILLIIQYFCYYVLGFHLQLIITPFLKSSASQWIALAQTGRISVSGNLMKFYRPSAFFLEPSHLTIFLTPILTILLLSKKRNILHFLTVILISLGMVLSTSGMGIVLVIGLWALFIFNKLTKEANGFTEKIRMLFKPKTLIFLLVFCLIVFVLYLTIEPIRMSINRIFLSSSSGKSAISGRTSTGFKLIKELVGWEFWFGKSDWGNVHKWNMTGFFYPFYTQGLIGMLLSYGFYVLSLFKTKSSYFWLSLIVIGLSFFTLHTNAAYYMMYFVFFMLNGFDKTNDKFVIKNALYDKIKK